MASFTSTGSVALREMSADLAGATNRTHHRASQRRDRVIFIDSADFFQENPRARESSNLGGINRPPQKFLMLPSTRVLDGGYGKYLHILIFPRSFHGQANIIQRDAQDFGDREVRHFLLLFPGVRLVAYSGLSSASSTPSLSTGGFRDPALYQARQLSLGVVLNLLRPAGVDDIYNIIDCDRRLQRG